MADRMDSELVGQLMALFAHDLRNPLSALHSNVSFLSSMAEGLDPEAHEALDDAGVSCEGLAHIIDNLDVFAHFLTGRRQVPRIRIAAGAVVAESAHRCEHMAASHGAKIYVEPGVSTLDASIKSNREMLVRALSNLICNSVQHGGDRIDVSASVVGRDCLIRIADRGSPLTGDYTTLAFTAAGQVSTKGSHGGRYSRGLGLFVAALAAEAAGATVTAGPGGVEGCFLVSVPLE